MKIEYFTLTDNPIEYGSTTKDPNRMIKDPQWDLIRFGCQNIVIAEEADGLMRKL